MASCFLIFHRWRAFERIGFVTTERCSRCGKTRIRVC